MATQQKQEDSNLSEQLDDLIARMNQIQKQIRATQQPASMHEIDELKRLGNEYATVVAKLEDTTPKEGK